MKFNLDENLGRRAGAVLVEAGFDVATVSDQRLESAPDREVIDHCVREERCLVTMDAEFANPLQFPPHHYRGIVLLRLPARVTTIDSATSAEVEIGVGVLRPQIAGWYA